MEPVTPKRKVGFSQDDSPQSSPSSPPSSPLEYSHLPSKGASKKPSAKLALNNDEQEKKNRRRSIIEEKKRRKSMILSPAK